MLKYVPKILDFPTLRFRKKPEDDVWTVVMTTALTSNQKLKNVYSVIAS